VEGLLREFSPFPSVKGLKLYGLVPFVVVAMAVHSEIVVDINAEMK
jgi:hypothetical protein